jgi:hypothetical protein
MLHNPEIVRPFQVVNSHRQTGRENNEKAIHRAKPLNSEEPTFQNSIAALPLVTYEAIECTATDLPNFPDSNARFRFVNSQSDVVTIGKTNFNVVATSSSDILCRFRFAIGK